MPPRSGYGVNFLDLSGIENYLDALPDFIVRSTDAVVEITATTPQLPAVIKIAQTIRKLRPDIKLIQGGPHVTLVYSALKLERKRGVLHGREFAESAGLVDGHGGKQRERQLEPGRGKDADDAPDPERYPCGQEVVAAVSVEVLEGRTGDDEAGDDEQQVDAVSEDKDLLKRRDPGAIPSEQGRQMSEQHDNDRDGAKEFGVVDARRTRRLNCELSNALAVPFKSVSSICRLP